MEKAENEPLFMDEHMNIEMIKRSYMNSTYFYQE